MSLDPEYRQDNTAIFSVVLNLANGSITINNDDIKELYFIEDIYQYSITGKLIFNDRNGIFEYGPFTGNETITVIYNQSTIRSLEFYIFKNSKVLPTSGSVNTGRLCEIILVDKYFYGFNKFEFSKSWYNTKISDIVSDISQYMIKAPIFDLWEDTKEKVENFIMPYWTPSKAINWLVKRGTGTRSGVPGFVFFNNSKYDGQHFISSNFVTLDTLFNQPKLMTIDPQDDGLYVLSDENCYLYNKILSHSTNGIDFQSVRRLMGGHEMGFDPSKKEFLVNKTDFQESLKKFTMLGKQALFANISNKEGSHDISGEISEILLKNIQLDEWIKKYSLQNCISIVVKGHDFRHAGGLIEIMWPSKREEDRWDKNRKGKYLVKSITHYFQGSAKLVYTQKMVLMKNAYQETDSDAMVYTSKKNL